MTWSTLTVRAKPKRPWVRDLLILALLLAVWAMSAEKQYRTGWDDGRASGWQDGVQRGMSTCPELYQPILAAPRTDT